MHYKTSESTATSYSQVIHDGDGEIKTTPLWIEGPMLVLDSRIAL